MLKEYLNGRNGKFKARTRRALLLVIDKGLRQSEAARATGMSKQQINAIVRRYNDFVSAQALSLTDTVRPHDTLE